MAEPAAEPDRLPYEIRPPAALVADLLTALDVEAVGDDLFRSAPANPNWPRLFGGQVVAQALRAAQATVPADRAAHSLHAYFVRSGDPRSRVTYTVTRDHDGGSFSTRRVVAQQQARTIFTLSASFQGIEPGYEHQPEMPTVPPPETLRCETEIRRAQIGLMLPGKHGFLLRGMPIELRPVTPRDFSNLQKQVGAQQYWFRPVAPVPADPGLAQAILAYVSDMMLLSTTLLPHGVHWSTTEIQNASLDHSLWLHRPAALDDWMLFALESPWAGNARGLARGMMFDRSGQLVASVAQEGLVRRRGTQQEISQ